MAWHIANRIHSTLAASALIGLIVLRILDLLDELRFLVSCYANAIMMRPILRHNEYSNLVCTQ
jgi:hypothetical protein